MNKPYKPGMYWAFPKGKKEPTLVMVEAKAGGEFAVKAMRATSERPIENFEEFFQVDKPLKDVSNLLSTASAHTLQCYEASYYPVYRDQQTGRSYERNETVLFTEEDTLAACKSAVRFAMQNFRTCGESYGYLYIGCLKLNGFQIGRPTESGITYPSRSFGYIMEWKCDMGLYHPKNPDQELRDLIAEMKSLTSEHWVRW